MNKKEDVASLVREEVSLDEADRRLINGLQGGFPVCDRPFAEVAGRLDMTEEEVIERTSRLLDAGVLTRFGPLYHAEKLGGGLTLAAMKIPDAEFDAVVEAVNSFPEVAHNYARDHALNMWFVLATETPERISEVIGEIEAKTGYRVYNMPREAEFFVSLRFEA
ncbi:MAG: Lrp/AsnC family transcriptional regulator [Rhodospirillales bacterium]|nr:Lrp/AsnC family transcriptional regulator [Rhodospirillales bacterium]MCW8861571.1 Lrp/AsnC family transcriptional regulator [Rhodospirillales bacterium]MCW8951846.1 Lrp/AsnC family transcriptional regulator [Rhodospirillales bacterium]MCW8971072.1 Lrp/AsnC family transcriptional regulator [Rhodospirillales bacterium]MCW9001934.1 Lrp/AsnC family transcriptional regulator [Rhodospirillales bacterium]